MRLFILVMLSLPACSQTFSFGVKGGVPLTDFFNTAESGQVSYFRNTNRYLAGPTVEVDLPHAWGLEVDAIYRHLNFQNTAMGVDTFSTSSAKANAWEFPVLARYRIPVQHLHLFVDTGVAVETLQGVTEKTIAVTILGVFTSSPSQPSELQHRTIAGFVAGGGIRLQRARLRVQPEIRYTRWSQRHFEDAAGLLSSTQNQAEFLLGITF
jgi:hypothetical protein